MRAIVPFVIFLSETLCLASDIVLSIDVDTRETADVDAQPRTFTHDNLANLPARDIANHMSSVESTISARNAESPLPPSDGLYFALFSKEGEMSTTEDFLKTKVTSGTQLWQLFQDGQFKGWHALSLTPEAKHEIEDYQGISDVKDEGIIRRYMNMSGVTSNHVLPTTMGIATPRTMLNRRKLPAHTLKDNPPALTRRDDIEPYAVFVDNSTDIQKTEEYIKSKIEQGSEIYQIENDGQIQGWYNVKLTPDSAAAVKNYEGVSSMRVEGTLTFFRALPESERAGNSFSNIRRDGTWTKLKDADNALVMDSQYRGGDLSAMKDYVYRPEPGKGIYIYVIDRGVQLDVINEQFEYEFLPGGGDIGQLEVLQTARANTHYQGDDPRSDSTTDSHGTGVASKALGARYGVAKAATVVSVKITNVEFDAEEGIRVATRDIISKGRQKNSVVILSAGMETSLTRDQLSTDATYLIEYYSPVRRLLDLGVPLICASGNFADQPGRQDIDSLPQLYQGDDLPIINVGAAGYDGQRWYKSQGGPVLTLYAPGVDVLTMSKVEQQHVRNSGTSLAAPQVAGLIATYLSHEPTSQQWKDLTGITRIKAIRDYLVSDKSSWERSAGIRMIWNGAAKEDHQNAGANGGDVPPPPTQAPPPVLRNKALAIIIRNTITEADNINEWLFYLTNKGTSKVCDKGKPILTAKAPGGPSVADNPPWPGGTYELMDLDGMKCEYKNDGSSAGALWCDGRGAIPCSADSLRAVGEKGTKQCGLGVYDHPVVFCEW